MKKVVYLLDPYQTRIEPEQTVLNISRFIDRNSGDRLPYMQKTCDVAEKAILANKNCGKSA